MDIFEQASRVKLRFPFRGLSSAEDLWDLSREELDALHSALTATQKKDVGESLIKRRSTNAIDILDLQIQLVKHVFTAITEAQSEQRKAVENKNRKQHLLALVANKQDAELAGLSVDELNAMIDKL